MRKINALAGVAALAIMTAACSGGGSEPAEPAAEEPAAEAPAEEPAEEAPAAEPAADGDPMATTDGISYASLTGDAAAGKAVFAQCRTCHETKEGVNKTGPSLAGIVGRPAGSVDGFNYSPANANSGLTWTEEQLYVYLEDPQRTIPKTKMIFPGLPKAQDRANVIAYLKDPS
ncbi:cytochrome c family protein [Pontixanthobacter aestiaquae]|uniref:C-type cytochrome n=1 Tax=Pontixanthobacter aestiaquae TaxID=1509367 RepID=A0A844ZEL8_9SPHN|nr:cytochrome c family protein [Pontixanthobacter aestiaquae]MDN3644794.1 cytochrome c family protein [Pontixanthobacter aestiaquae]MXO84199.1 c-type cytochrome [Pontixanthobacter aestiaquae]